MFNEDHYTAFFGFGAIGIALRYFFKNFVEDSYDKKTVKTMKDDEMQGQRNKSF